MKESQQTTTAFLEGASPYSLWDLVRYFLMLGTLGFGGPVALVGYMRRDLVERRGWISESDYLAAGLIVWLVKAPPTFVSRSRSTWLSGLFPLPMVSLLVGATTTGGFLWTMFLFFVGAGAFDPPVGRSVDGPDSSTRSIATAISLAVAGL